MISALTSWCKSFSEVLNQVLTFLITVKCIQHPIFCYSRWKKKELNSWTVKNWQRAAKVKVFQDQTGWKGCKHGDRRADRVSEACDNCASAAAAMLAGELTDLLLAGIPCSLSMWPFKTSSRNICSVSISILYLHISVWWEAFFQILRISFFQDKNKNFFVFAFVSFGRGKKRPFL